MLKRDCAVLSAGPSSNSQCERDAVTGSVISSDAGWRLRIVLLLVLSVSMVSSASILIRFSQSDALVKVFWRTLLGGIIMLSAGLARGDHKRTPRRQDVRGLWKWLLLVGIVLSLHFSTWFISLELTTVAASVVLVNNSPIFTALLSTAVLRESLTHKSWVGVLVAVGGTVVLAWNDLLESGLGALTGDLLAIVSGVFLSLYFVGGRKYAAMLPLTVYTTTVYFSAAAATLVLCLVLGADVFVPVFIPYEMMIFLALAIFPTALGHSVNNYLLTLVPAYIVSSAVLGEPIGASLLAAVILGEIPSLMTFVGFAVILFGISLVLVGTRARNTRKQSSLDNPDGTKPNDLRGNA